MNMGVRASKLFQTVVISFCFMLSIKEGWVLSLEYVSLCPQLRLLTALQKRKESRV